jgi:hypothetical protein
MWAVATFAIFDHVIEKTTPEFWFMMQLGMLAGFLTAYPVNWWLLRAGLRRKCRISIPRLTRRGSFDLRKNSRETQIPFAYSATCFATG